jgi:hypothetical protein
MPPNDAALGAERLAAVRRLAADYAEERRRNGAVAALDAAEARIAALTAERDARAEEIIDLLFQRDELLGRAEAAERREAALLDRLEAMRPEPDGDGRRYHGADPLGGD